MEQVYMIDIISPGVVGTVGDAIAQVQLKTSLPDAQIRNAFSTTQSLMYGSNVQDGTSSNFVGYGQPYVIDKKLVNISIKTPQGWATQDYRPPDKRYDPAVSFSFSNFDNQRARVFNARRTGDMFLPLPGAYEPLPTDVPRGGLVPRITDLAAGDFTPSQGSVVTNPILAPKDRVHASDPQRSFFTSKLM